MGREDKEDLHETWLLVDVGAGMGGDPAVGEKKETEELQRELKV